MKRYIVERTVNDEPTGINWEFDTREEALAFFKQAAEDLPREWKTEKQSSCTPLTDTWAYELSACPDGKPGRVVDRPRGRLQVHGKRVGSLYRRLQALS